MPELPEVETLVQGVKQDLLGKSFANITFLRPDIREPIPTKKLKRILQNQKIEAVSRRGKYMLIRTAKGSLGIHLGMSGRFVRCRADDEVIKHTHAIFECDKSLQYRFIDARRFGRIFSIDPHQEAQHPFLEKLGVEPFENKERLGDYLFEASRKRSQAVKIFLMDSHVVVGVGNIYASESLWRAKIHPSRKANLITRHEYAVLAAEVIAVLSEAILAGGTSFKDYRNKDDKPGTFQVNLAVYGRASKSCHRCGQLIVKTQHALRSTYHCDICQK